ncbi:MAG: sigma-54 dependent transcriptional regulator [Planctomycetota bacterium]
MSPRVLVIDDDQNVRRSLEKVLRKERYDVSCASSGPIALRSAGRSPFDVVITDLVMEPMDGMDILRALKAIDRSAEVVMLTGHGTVERAVEAMKLGACDFLIKPVTREELLKSVSKALERRALLIENRRLAFEARERSEFRDIIGTSKRIEDVLSLVRQVAPSRATVLIEGESGTGKELVARAVHDYSGRRDHPFVAVNCGALPETLLEAELFGAVKGAYTGAHETRPGRFDVAHTGTLLLDEIAEMSPSAQVKLLRVLENGEFQPLGSTQTHTVDVRVIAATNRPLEPRINEGRFRSDLYFRLNVIRIRLPALRERPEDISVLAWHFLNLYSERYGKTDLSFTEGALARLSRYAWPGNVRELENAVERAVVLACDQLIDEGDLPAEVVVGPSAPLSTDLGVFVPHGSTLAEAEKLLIEETLARFGGDKRKTARALGIGLRTVYRKVNEAPPAP